MHRPVGSTEYLVSGANRQAVIDFAPAHNPARIAKEEHMDLRQMLESSAWEQCLSTDRRPALVWACHMGDTTPRVARKQLY